MTTDEAREVVRRASANLELNRELARRLARATNSCTDPVAKKDLQEILMEFFGIGVRS